MDWKRRSYTIITQDLDDLKNASLIYSDDLKIKETILGIYYMGKFCFIFFSKILTLAERFVMVL